MYHLERNKHSTGESEEKWSFVGLEMGYLGLSPGEERESSVLERACHAPPQRGRQSNPGCAPVGL